MEPRRWTRRAYVIAPIAIGAVALIWSLTLPWTQADFRLGATIRVLMAAAGAAILVVAGRDARGGALVVATRALGICVLAYPVVLAVGAAYPSNPAASIAGTAGHVPPLLLIQVIPILAATAAVARRHRRWEAAFVIIAAAMIGCGALGYSSVPGAGGFALAGSALWFGSALIAPVATWAAVRGSGSEERSRAVLAALAAMVPAALIIWCVALGALGEGFGLGVDWSVSTLMAGFSLSTSLCAVLSLGAVAPTNTWMLRSRTLIAVLDGLLAAFALLVACLAALVSSILSVPPGWSVLLGAGVALAAGTGWWQARSWTRRVVDPASPLRRELAALDRIAEGNQRGIAQQALRRVARDPELAVAFVLEGSVADGAPSDSDRFDPGRGVVLARHAGGETSVVASTASAPAAQRLRRLGDCTALLRPALLEASAARAARSAELAAKAERRRLAQNLHDGLQGRLLGLALNLQLSGQELADPTARLLVDETVGSLRSIVEDVRSLGGGSVPEILTTEGLGPALRLLLAPVAAMVHLELPEERLTPATEATAYFVIGEAVTNALKHARAERISVCIDRPSGGSVAITVRDDGCGGADPRAGSGLRELSERVSAGGTVVETVLSCAS